MPENIDLMVKLFETLKQSSDKNEATLQKLIEQQHSLIGHIEYLPIKDLQEALKEHNKDSSINITACTDTVNSTSNSILEKVKKIDGKVGKMITVVLVVFSLLTITFIIARMTMNPEFIDKKINTVISTNRQTEHSEIIEALKDTVKKEFVKINDRINELHVNDKEHDKEHNEEDEKK